jgi:hypothetical protein
MRESARCSPVTAIAATDLAPLLNGYTIRAGPPKIIVVARASQVASLQDVTVSGTLLRKQVIALDPATGSRTVSLGANGGAYTIEADGDLHFCLGVKPLTPHITCELQRAATWLPIFQASVGGPVAASGFFRCLFEHPGFDANDDAHIFEIHPVRAVSLAGKSQTFDVDLPDPNSIHTWLSPHPLNVQDARIRVSYDAAKDTLTFLNMDGTDENYVRLAGTVSGIQIGSGAAVSTFTLMSLDIGHPIRVFALPGTRAARQLAAFAGGSVTLVALRNIDLPQALRGAYVINLLAIDIQPGP